MLTMKNLLHQKTPVEISKELAQRLKYRRKKMKISQSELAKLSGVSLGSIKRFETKYEIALISLIKIAIVLDTEGDFDNLFSKKVYNSIEEIINGEI